MNENSQKTNPHDFGTILPKRGEPTDKQQNSQQSFEGTTLAKRKRQSQFYPEQDLEAYRSNDGTLRLYRATNEKGNPLGPDRMNEREFVKALRKDGSFDEQAYRKNVALTQDFQAGKISKIHVTEFAPSEKPRAHVGSAAPQRDAERKYPGGGQQIKMTQVPESKLTTYRVGTPECDAMGRSAQKRQAEVSDQQIQIRRLKARAETQAVARSRSELSSQAQTQSAPRPSKK